MDYLSRIIIISPTVSGNVTAISVPALAASRMSTLTSWSGIKTGPAQTTASETIDVSSQIFEDNDVEILAWDLTQRKCTLSIRVVSGGSVINMSAEKLDLGETSRRFELIFLAGIAQQSRIESVTLAQKTFDVKKMSTAVELNYAEEGQKLNLHHAALITSFVSMSSSLKSLK